MLSKILGIVVDMGLSETNNFIVSRIKWKLSELVKSVLSIQNPWMSFESHIYESYTEEL